MTDHANDAQQPPSSGDSTAGTTTPDRPVCRWGCGRPTPPRTGARGPIPGDCGLLDPEHGFVHNPQNWLRRKQGKLNPGQPAGPVDPDDARPVDKARRTAVDIQSRIEVAAASLAETVEHLQEALRTAGDPDAAAAQIAAAVADAEEKKAQAKAAYDREHAARIEAERARDMTLADAAEVSKLNTAAATDREEALAAAAAARQEAEELAGALQVAQAEITAAQDRVTQLDQQLGGANEQLVEARTLVGEQTARGDRLNQALTDMSADRDAQQHRAAQLDQDLTTATEGKRLAEAQVTALQGELAAARTLVGEQTARGDRLNQALTDMSADRDAQQHRAAQLGDQLTTATIRAGDAETQLATVTARLEEQTARGDRLDDQLTAAVGRAEHAENMAERERDAQTTADQATRTAEQATRAAESRADRAESTRDQLDARLTTAGEQLTEARADRDRLRAEREQAQAEAQAARHRVDHLTERVEQLTAQLLGERDTN